MFKQPLGGITARDSVLVKCYRNVLPTVMDQQLRDTCARIDIANGDQSLAITHTSGGGIEGIVAQPYGVKSRGLAGRPSNMNDCAVIRCVRIGNHQIQPEVRFPAKNSCSSKRASCSQTP